jgi:hypothetical protein
MNLQLQYGLPFVAVNLRHQDYMVEIENVLVDTGSAGTIFATDEVAKIGLILEPHDVIRRVRGVGGAEFVFSKRVDGIHLGEIQIAHFDIEVGGMDYGFPIGGILGMDFLHEMGMILDLGKLQISRPTS